ncbi:MULTISPECIES: HNH/ENDO VII family nuclease [unclassified Endozoicomonas]|uniref:HNH/ENDO VII family nuclease n=1 Tax=unclassified Endozoicomonas TaxID=2644528 RepID=UPI003BB4F0C3
MMDITAFKEVLSEQRPAIFSSFEKSDLSKEEMKALDSPITDRISSRSELEAISDSQAEGLQERGYSDKVIEAIGSKQEADIYCDANLRCEVVNGKDALVRSDIDLDIRDDFGKTNLERMESGKAPIDSNGRPYELHHIGQTSDAPLAELTKAEHMSNGNDIVLHDKQKESEIDRSEFGKERAEHWKARAEAINAELENRVV